jgi:hypothetical protein
VTVKGSPFCEHGKLRMSCPICKAAGRAADPGLKSSEYVSRDEREEKAEKRAAAPPKSQKLPGPGKPIMPTRRTKRKVTAEDEARAEAWWVKKK